MSARPVFVPLGLIVLACAPGCARHVIVAHNSTESAVMYGTVRIVGHHNDVTVEDFSRIEKLSIIGDGNTVFVEDNVYLVRTIEFWGNENVVSLPQKLTVAVRQVGANRIVVRQPESTPPPTTEPPPTDIEPPSVDTEPPPAESADEDIEP